MEIRFIIWREGKTNVLCDLISSIIRLIPNFYIFCVNISFFNLSPQAYLSDLSRLVSPLKGYRNWFSFQHRCFKDVCTVSVKSEVY